MIRVIGNRIGNEYPRNLLSLCEDGEVEEILAAVAYAHGTPELFEFAWRKKIKLTYWGRYDDSIPVSIPILETFISRASFNYRCFLVPGIFHPKVIWFVGKGLYIGSANLTDSAWNGNIELGVFFSQEEVLKERLHVKMEAFFSKLLQVGTPLTKEFVDNLKAAQSARDQVEREDRRYKDWFEKNRLIPKLPPLTFVDTRTEATKAKEAFLAEWHETLALVRNMADIVGLKENRPAWVNADVPKYALVDQFLNCYYDVQVRDPENQNRFLHHEMHEQNKSNPDRAFRDALGWFSALKEAPGGEDERLHIYAPKLKATFSRDRLRSLTDDEMADAFSMVNAFWGVARQVTNADLGLPAGTQTPKPERVKLLARKILGSQSPSGMKIRDVLFHVLYGGEAARVPERIWDSAFGYDNHIDHFGLSCLGELVGWALSDDYPPRNGRTSKALFALGNIVKIHTE